MYNIIPHRKNPFLFIAVDAGRSKSSNLVEKLLSDYGPRTVRPVKNESTVTTVVIQLLVRQIIALVRGIKNKLKLESVSFLRARGRLGGMIGYCCMLVQDKHVVYTVVFLI